MRQAGAYDCARLPPVHAHGVVGTRSRSPVRTHDDFGANIWCPVYLFRRTPTAALESRNYRRYETLLV